VHPLHSTPATATGQTSRGNSHNYIVDRSGTRILSHGSDVTPNQRAVVATIERPLAEKPAR